MQSADGWSCIPEVRAVFRGSYGGTSGIRRVEEVTKPVVQTAGKSLVIGRDLAASFLGRHFEADFQDISGLDCRTVDRV